MTAVDLQQRLTPRVWAAASVEIAIAVVVAVAVLDRGASPSGHHMHSGPRPISWTPGIGVLAAVTAAVLIWWLVSRSRILAAGGAAGLVGVAACEPVRTLALQSHLVGMAALETLSVGVPLLLLAAVRRPARRYRGEPSMPWTGLVGIAVALNAAGLIAVHIPALHSHASDLESVPLWLVALCAAIGMAYWAAILLPTRYVSSRVRRRALIVGQEVAAILGLAALLFPGPDAGIPTIFGLPTTLDQRLGGALMLVACAAVTLPLARQLAGDDKPQHVGTERNVY
ncbi:conserved membrane hypothetical protein [uncultured Mycobacterium sp.]|uniref:Uncharacterized protein n=1 Tax=uncultured Mycobacterium sp. TaxID=171292 RepID=A0A1Y5PKD0_9MYCO|nr:conserved membrane hypothetical protein [uncultured Mycobacterium sp.]